MTPVRRSLVMVALIALAAPVAGARAVTAAPCKPLISDPVGDTEMLADPSIGSVDNTRTLDIVAADIATNARRVTVAVTVDKLAYQGTNLNANIYEVRFTAAHGAYGLNATLGPDGSSAEAWKLDNSYDAHGASASTAHGIGSATVVFDAAHSQVRISADRSLFTADGPLGPRLTKVEAWTWRGEGYGAGHGPVGGPSWVASNVDETLTDATYRTDTKACIGA